MLCTGKWVKKNRAEGSGGGGGGGGGGAVHGKVGEEKRDRMWWWCFGREIVCRKTGQMMVAVPEWDIA